MSNDTHYHAHPFELAGLGLGPFRFIGVATIPSATLAEQNPDAYNGALRALPRDLIGGCGTCANCGQGISNICIIANAAGDRYGVGSDCVLKTGDPYLGDRVKFALARIQRDQRRARTEAAREARRKAYLARVCNEAGETNAQRIEREDAEARAALAARKTEAETRFGFVLPILDATSRQDGDFCSSIARGIRNGNVPRGRALDIVCDIYAKLYGRRNSAGYEAACAEFEKLTQ